MEKKSVLISTFNNSKNNYGGVFQAFALSDTIKNLGHDVRFVTIENPTGECSIKPSLISQFKDFVVMILSLPTTAKRKLREKKFAEFKIKTQSRVMYKDYADFEKHPPEADVYLSGSDQVWNPINLHKHFFFPNIAADKPLISYAASMGCEQISKGDLPFFKDNIARYDAVSVREDTMADIISTYTSKKVLQHIDPVFLVDRSKWETMAKEYKKLKYEQYILLYLISWDKSKTEALIRLKKESGLPLVLVTLGGRKPPFADQVVMDASPEEFLYLLLHAKMVVATSFHGVALSIVLNKPFIAVSGHNPTRIQSLLRLMELEDHDTYDMTYERAQFDPNPIRQKIETARETAITYLKESIAMNKFEE